MLTYSWWCWIIRGDVELSLVMLNYPRGTYGPMAQDRPSRPSCLEDPRSAYNNTHSQYGKILEIIGASGSFTVWSASASFTLHNIASLITLASQCLFTLAGQNNSKLREIPTRCVRLESENALWRDCQQRCKIIEGELRNDDIETRLEYGALFWFGGGLKTLRRLTFLMPSSGSFVVYFCSFLYTFNESHVQASF